MGVLDPQPLIFVLPLAGSLYLFFAIHYGAKQNSCLFSCCSFA